MEINLRTLRTFFGWCTVINLGFLLFNTIAILTIKDWASGFHAELFNLQEEAVRMAFYEFIAIYKIAWFVFSCAPYFALCLMTQSKSDAEGAG